MSEARAEITIAALRAMKGRGEKIACLTAYDASLARVLEGAGIEVLLVGDSLGNVVQGHATTLPVTLDDMVYHTRCVARGRQSALLMADMPFMSDASPERALDSAARLMGEGGAHVVKLEGGRVMEEAVRRLSERGLPVCAHLGLLPQSVHKSGYRARGRDGEEAAILREDARRLEEAGADVLLLECVTAALAAEITANATVPVIGIGAGACDGQVLVLYDVLGITPGRRPRFSADFLAGTQGGVAAAVQAYVRAVKDGVFPGPEHMFD